MNLVKEEFARILELCWAFTVFASQEGSKFRQHESIASDLSSKQKQVVFTEEERAMAIDTGLWASMVEVIQAKLDDIGAIRESLDELEAEMKIGGGDKEFDLF